jgi:hypothetical protein
VRFNSDSIIHVEMKDDNRGTDELTGGDPSAPLGNAALTDKIVITSAMFWREESAFLPPLANSRSIAYARDDNRSMYIVFAKFKASPKPDTNQNR